ncbi:MAG: PD-(D/E)XK nuclease family protein [bacterium]
MIYSHSRLETFESCRLKFKYQYIDKPDILKRESVEAFLGSRVHDTLEALYKNKLMAKEWTRAEFLKHYETIWQRQLPESIYIVNKEYTLEHYFQQGYQALEKYWDHYFPFDQEKTIALEQRVQISLDRDGRYRLQGFIDRLSKSPEGVWQIRDYKTKRRLATQEQADRDRQLALYNLGVQAMWPDAQQAELIWHYLLFDEEIKSLPDRERLERVRIVTILLIQEVERAIEADDYPYNESALCDWCDFFDICPAKKHLSQIRQLPPREFKEDEGVKLVDRYAQLKRMKSEIDEELVTLRDQLIAFADQFEIDKVYGSSNRASITRRDTLSVPESRDKERREQLEQLLKECGVWERVSHLYGPRLVKLYEQGELPEELTRRIDAFLDPKVEASVRLAKTKTYDENFENN